MVMKLQDNYARIAGDDPDVDELEAAAPPAVPHAPLGHASLMRGMGPMPLGFPDAVFNSFGDLARQVGENKRATQQILRLLNQNQALPSSNAAPDPAVLKPKVSFV